MKVEILSVKPLNYYVFNGDTVTVEHTYHNHDLRKDTAVLRHKVARRHKLSYSIVFTLNGITNQIVGDQATVDWITGLAEN